MKLITETRLPTKYGVFKLKLFKGKRLHLVLIRENISKTVLIRIHSRCTTGDALFSLRCDCGEQLRKALEKIGKKGGVLIYSDEEGRGIGLENKIRTYALQDKGFDSVEANEKLGFEPDQRNYREAAQIIKKLGITSVKLLTNNPQKIEALKKEGIEVKRVPLKIRINKENKRYLETKRKKLHHLI